MSRKEEIVKIPLEWGGRDADKLFRLKEMSSSRSEKWAIRAMLLFQRNGARIPDEIAGRGMEAIAIIGLNVLLQGNIEFEKLEPLLDEMMTCVEIIRDPRAPNVTTPIVSDDDIEEPKTRFFLRSEVLRLHLGFSPLDLLSALMSAALKPLPAPDSTST